MKDSDKPKLIIALVVLAIAGVLIAWQYGLFESKPSTTAPATGSDAPKSGGPRAIPNAK